MSEETKACRFCGEQILAVAVKCKHCGSDLAQTGNSDLASPASPKAGPKAYSEVPWYRKNSFAILAFFFLGPAVGLVAATGPIYYEKKGALLTYGKVQRGFLVIWSIVWVVIVLASGSGAAVGGTMERIGSCEFYRQDSVTAADVSKVATVLGDDACKGDRKTFQLRKPESTFEFEMVVKTGMENDPVTLATMRQAAQELTAALGGTVDIHLCDDHMKTLRVVVP